MTNDPTNKAWQSEVSELLARAAQLCVEQGVEMDPFMRGAASAYLEASPATRAYLEELQLKATLQMMRNGGRIATA